MTFNSPLSKVRGMGSSHGGSAHWLGQRISALVLIPLSLWLVKNLLEISRSGSGLEKWLASPYAAMFTAMLMVAVFYHAAQGIRVILEDYIKCKTTLIASILFTKAICSVAAAASVMAIIKLHFA